MGDEFVASVMKDRQELVDIIDDTAKGSKYDGVAVSNPGEIADEILDAGWRKTKVIAEAEQRDALKVGSVLMDAAGEVSHRGGHGWHAVVHESNGEVWLTDVVGPPLLPGILLWDGDWFEDDEEED